MVLPVKRGHFHTKVHPLRLEKKDCRFFYRFPSPYLGPSPTSLCRAASRHSLKWAGPYRGNVPVVTKPRSGPLPDLLHSFGPPEQLPEHGIGRFFHFFIRHKLPVLD